MYIYISLKSKCLLWMWTFWHAQRYLLEVATLSGWRHEDRWDAFTNWRIGSPWRATGLVSISMSPRGVPWVGHLLLKPSSVCSWEDQGVDTWYLHVLAMNENNETCQAKAVKPMSRFFDLATPATPPARCECREFERLVKWSASNCRNNKKQRTKETQKQNQNNKFEPQKFEQQVPILRWGRSSFHGVFTYRKLTCTLHLFCAGQRMALAKKRDTACNDKSALISVSVAQVKCVALHEQF